MGFPAIESHSEADLTIQQLKSRSKDLNENLTKHRTFLKDRGLQTEFKQFLHPKKRSVKEKLHNKQKQISEQKDAAKQHQTKKKAVAQGMDQR